MFGFGGAGQACDGFADGYQGVGGVELGGLKEAVGGAELFYLGGGEATSLEAHFVDAVGVIVPLDAGERVGEDVLGGHGASAYVGVAAYSAELVDGAEGTHYGVVLYDDVAGEGGGVGEDAVVADVGVVADVAGST